MLLEAERQEEAREQFRIASSLDPHDTYLAHLAAGGRSTWQSQISDQELEDSRNLIRARPLQPAAVTSGASTCRRERYCPRPVP